MESAQDEDTSSVCFFTVSHNTTDSRVVNREAVSLSEAGYDVTYYTPFEGESRVETVSFAEESIDALPSIRDRLVWVVTLLRVLYDTDYDVYHFHDVELLPLGVLLGRLTEGVVIYDVHEDVEAVLNHKDIFPRPIRPPLVAAVSATELFLARFLDGIVVASPDIADRFDDHDEVTVVTNYPRRRWANETDPGSLRASTGGSEVRFVYRGLLWEDRGVFTMIDAVERVPDAYDVSLVVGGKYASDELRDRLHRRAAESDRVDVVDWFPTLEDVIDHYRDADVGMMCFHPDPNATNAVHRSNKLFQYMATGLPVIVSDIGNWPDLVSDVDCGIAVDPENPDDIARAMVRLVEERERRERLGRNGHRAALERFNWEHQRERLLALYERLEAPRPDVGPTPEPAREEFEAATD